MIPTIWQIMLKLVESSFQLCELYLSSIQDHILSFLADFPLNTLQVGQDS